MPPRQPFLSIRENWHVYFPGSLSKITCTQNTLHNPRENTSPAVNNRSLSCKGRAANKRTWRSMRPFYRIVRRCSAGGCSEPGKSPDKTRPDRTRPNQNNNNKVNYLPNTQIKASKCSFSFKALGTASNSPKNRVISFGVNSRFEAITLKQIIL